MANNHMNGKFGEISHQSTVVVQTTQNIKDMVDRRLAEPADYLRFPGAPDPTLQHEIVRVDIGDPVFMPEERPGRNVLNNALKACSYLNGMKFPKSRVPRGTDRNTTDEQTIINLLTKQIRFLGVALGPTIPNPENEKDSKTQFTTRVQGTVEMMNTGLKVFYPGDTILWKVPYKHELDSAEYRKLMPRYGRDANKVTLSLEPLSVAHDNLTNSVTDALENGGGALAKNDGKGLTPIEQYGHDMVDFMMYTIYSYLKMSNDPQVKDSGNTFLTFDDWIQKPGTKTMQKNFMTKDTDGTTRQMITKCVKTSASIYEDYKHRYVGKALSHAKPGEMIDVLLGAN